VIAANLVASKTAERIEMAWFDEGHEDRVMITFAMAGALGGAVFGFQLGGLGRSILFVILGGIAGFFLSGFVTWIFDIEAVTGCGLIVTGIMVFIGIPALIIFLIYSFWNVGT